jgi:hypothetical protein
MPDLKHNLYRFGIFPLLLIVLSVSMRGQDLNVAAYGGINVSQVDGDIYTGFNKLGFNAGMSVNRLIDKQFYWQAEIKYSTRGVYEGPTDNNQSLYKSSYHILELPLSVHYLFEERIKVELGTSPEFLITSLFWDENGLMDRATYPDNRRVGLSVFAGIGYWFSQRMMAGIRYTNSAVPFRDPEEWNNPQYRGFFHNAISVSLAYQLSRHQSGMGKRGNIN